MKQYYIEPKLKNKIQKLANDEVNARIEIESKDPMNIDYYKGYRHGLSDAPFSSCNEAFELLHRALEEIEGIENNSLKQKIEKYLKGK